MSAPSLLVVSGEASGDRALSQVLRRLHNVDAFGMGGGATEHAGAELLVHSNDLTAMGISEVAMRAVGISKAFVTLLRAAKERRPRAALLVNYSEFNARLAPKLKALGIRVLWYGPPQVWAWRKSRMDAIRRSTDRLAVMFPFEESLWRASGADAHYVGHPAMEDRSSDGELMRRALDLPPSAFTVALLPGSRPHEVRKLLSPMILGYENVRRERASVDGRLLLAPSLDNETRTWAIAQAAAHHISVLPVDPSNGIGPMLSGFDAAICASGTAVLECVLARTIPLVAYKVGLITESVARLAVSIPQVSLPNILLGKNAFPELLQRAVTPENIARELTSILLNKRDFLRSCDEVEAILGTRTAPSRDVARLLLPWLEARTDRRAELLPLSPESSA